MPVAGLPNLAVMQLQSGLHRQARVDAALWAQVQYGRNSGDLTRVAEGSSDRCSCLYTDLHGKARP